MSSCSLYFSPSAFCRRTAQLLRDTISRVSVASQTTCCQKCYFRSLHRCHSRSSSVMLMITGKQNCSWSSCREGCTKEIFNCWQVVLLLVLLVLLVSLVSLPSTHSECNVDEDEYDYNDAVQVEVSYQLVEEEEGDSNQAPATRSSQVSTTGKLFPNVKVRQIYGEKRLKVTTKGLRLSTPRCLRPVLSRVWAGGTLSLLLEEEKVFDLTIEMT